MAVSESQVRVTLRSEGAPARAVTASLAYGVGARADVGIDRLDELLIAIDLLVGVADRPVELAFDATAAGLDVTVGAVGEARLAGLLPTLAGLTDRVSAESGAITLSIDG